MKLKKKFDLFIKIITFIIIMFLAMIDYDKTNILYLIPFIIILILNTYIIIKYGRNEDK